MREIKFQYLIETRKEIAREIFTLEEIENGIFLGNLALPRRVIAKRQYTGLKDKNGVEIYEGDIVTDTEANAPVFYFQEECQFIADFGEGIEYQILGEWCEVIGNIYENKELLS